MLTRYGRTRTKTRDESININFKTKQTDMKKIKYQAPKMEVVELKSKSVLLAGSDGETAGGGGTGFAPEYEPEE